MSGQSNVGNAQVYEAGDQRNPPNSEQNQATPYEEGKANSHNVNDPSIAHTPFFRPPQPLTANSEDQRSIGNRLAAAEPQNDDSSRKNLDAESKAAQKDPTLPARMHGNEPSKGAKIDKEIEDEEAEILAKKDAAAAAKGKN